MVSTTTRLEEGGGEKATVVIWGHVTLVAILVRPARPRAHMLLLLGRLYRGGCGGRGTGREVAQSLYSSCSSRGRPRILQARAERTQGKDALISCHKGWHIVLEQFFFVLDCVSSTSWLPYSTDSCYLDLSIVKNIIRIIVKNTSEKFERT